MTVAAWMINAMPSVKFDVRELDGVWPAFWHVNTTVICEESGATGQTVWMAEVGEESAGIAWDWAEVRPNVMAVGDPNGISTNLRFFGADGAELAPLRRIICAMEIVRGLNWESPARAALRSRREPKHFMWAEAYGMTGRSQPALGARA